MKTSEGVPSSAVHVSGRCRLKIIREITDCLKLIDEIFELAQHHPVKTKDELETDEKIKDVQACMKFILSGDFVPMNQLGGHYGRGKKVVHSGDEPEPKEEMFVSDHYVPVGDPFEFAMRMQESTGEFHVVVKITKPNHRFGVGSTWIIPAKHFQPYPYWEAIEP